MSVKLWKSLNGLGACDRAPTDGLPLRLAYCSLY